MHLLDWCLVTIPLLTIVAVGLYTRRYMRSVADFLSGGRHAGRYLLAVSRGEMASGAVVFVGVFELIEKSGFTTQWWGWLSAPIGLLVSICGFVVYRYRETRVLTLAQFFEVRYSRKFRLFSGVLGFGAGMVNFGIIPAVGSRFIASFIGLPPTVTLFSLTIPSYIPLMAVLLSITLTLTLSGGLITSMVTNCLEGIFSQVLYLVIIAGLITMFTWPEISHVMGDRPAGQSLLNPFDSLALKDFNIWYMLMGLFLMVYGTLAWQNQSSYNSAALSAHEARMGNIMGSWRGMGSGVLVSLLGICALTYLQHPDFASQSASVHMAVSKLGDEKVQQQMLMPMAVTHLLPTGLKGALCVILLMGVFGGDSTHLHSWGGLFVQDILVPLRKKPFTPEQHIKTLRLGITMVAIFAFLFGSLFQQTEYVFMWFTVTMGLFVGGAGAVIIGGLYWKKGTTAGAWSSMLTGLVFCGGGIIARQIYGETIPLNGMEISFYGSLLSIAVYVAVSLLTFQEDFDMDRMLHRGRYADSPEIPTEKKRWSWQRLVGFDEHFTFGDKCLAGFLMGWGLLWFVVFVVGTVWNLIAPWPLSAWSMFWNVVGVALPIFWAITTGIWFTWGGIRDMQLLFSRLRHEKINPLDNGMVVDHQNLDGSAAVDRPQIDLPIKR